MVCVYCGGETKVTNSRWQKRSNQVWRRRQCLACHSVFTTHEQIELKSALLVDRSGQTQAFLPDLLLKDLMLALKHRSDVYTASGEVMATIIHRLLGLPQKPVYKATDISEAAATVLKRFDKQAYLRYVAEHPSTQGRGFRV